MEKRRNTRTEVSEARAPDPKEDFCVFLQTLGLTDAARDCDIVAYIRALAQAKKK